MKLCMMITSIALYIFIPDSDDLDLVSRSRMMSETKGQDDNCLFSASSDPIEFALYIIVTDM